MLFKKRYRRCLSIDYMTYVVPKILLFKTNQRGLKIYSTMHRCGSLDATELSAPGVVVLERNRREGFLSRLISF